MPPFVLRFAVAPWVSRFSVGSPLSRHRQNRTPNPTRTSLLLSESPSVSASTQVSENTRRWRPDVGDECRLTSRRLPGWRSAMWYLETPGRRWRSRSAAPKQCQSDAAASGRAGRRSSIRTQCRRPTGEPNSALPLPRRHAEVHGTESDDRLRHRRQHVPEPARFTDDRMFGVDP